MLTPQLSAATSTATASTAATTATATTSRGRVDESVPSKIIIIEVRVVSVRGDWSHIIEIKRGVGLAITAGRVALVAVRRDAAV